MDELKAMASGGETPAKLGPVMNVLPLYRIVSENDIDWAYTFSSSPEGGRHDVVATAMGGRVSRSCALNYVFLCISSRICFYIVKDSSLFASLSLPLSLNEVLE